MLFLSDTYWKREKGYRWLETEFGSKGVLSSPPRVRVKIKMNSMLFRFWRVWDCIDDTSHLYLHHYHGNGPATKMGKGSDMLHVRCSRTGSRCMKYTLCLVLICLFRVAYWVLCCQFVLDSQNIEDLMYASYLHSYALHVNSLFFLEKYFLPFLNW